MGKEKKAVDPAKVFGALAHPIRLAILRMLMENTAIVSDMVESFELEQTKISKHLAILRQAGLVRCSPEGRCRRYQLRRPEALASLLETAQAWPIPKKKP